MNGTRSPLSLPALALLSGVWVATGLPVHNLGLAVALFACGVALGRRAGSSLAFLALGLAWTWGCSPAGSFGILRPSSDRPVIATGRLISPWTWRGFDWGSRIAIDELAQGDSVTRRHDRVSIALGGPRGSALPPFGALIRARGYMRQASALGDQPPLTPGAWRLAVKSRRLLSIESRPPALVALISRLRGRISGTLSRLARSDRGKGTALAQALILGESRAVPLPWRRGMRRAGLSHLLAISGLHVAMVGALAFFIGALWHRRAGLVASAASILVYVGIVGPRPSLLRAALMALIALASLRSRRPPVIANALALAVIVLLLGNPALIGDLGFCLTIGATAGIVHLAPLLGARWTSLRPSGVRRALAVTVAAQIATLPWALPAFHLLTPMAPIANLFFVPWTALTLAVGLATVAAAACWWPLGTLLAHLLDWIVWPYAALAKLPPGSLLTLPIVVGFFAAATLAVALTACLLRPRRWLPWGAIAALIVAGWLARPRERRPQLVAFDVGQGDCLLLRDGREAVLIDGGGWHNADFGGRVVLPALARLGVRHLRAIILSHPDLDHCGGLADIASYLRVDALWTLRDWPRSPCWSELESDGWLEKRWLQSGERLRVGRWHLLVLGPGPAPRSDDNDRSVVIEATALGRRILLTGDLERSGEESLLSRWPRRLLVSDVLKVAHHGSRTSTTPPFLAAVHPRLALISVGRFNPYHHPSPSVLERLRASGARILRTDRSGMIVLTLGNRGHWRLALPGEPKLR